MFRRTFWFSAGAAAGVWATTKVNRKLRSLTPESLAARAADRAVDTGHRLRELAVDVRAGMAQRERELTEALGLSAAPPEPGPAPASPAARTLPAQAARPRVTGTDRQAELARPTTGTEKRTTDGVG
ncbi:MULTISPECIES: DUF6167 family protein [Streptomyces]|uniref:DUF6167 family protein n=1 Tax=Streptomyces TaxID=1883 RepID=UPI002249868B|nr:DUF6167 family protein [Streptomyces sp. JHD 1]MCX2969979.1 DUF6167 family protein [Streptomyces sp. JHD 1]